MKEWSYSSTSKIWGVKFYIIIVQIDTKKSSSKKVTSCLLQDNHYEIYLLLQLLDLSYV